MVQRDRMVLLAKTLMVEGEGGPNNFTCLRQLCRSAHLQWKKVVRVGFDISVIA